MDNHSVMRRHWYRVLWWGSLALVGAYLLVRVGFRPEWYFEGIPFSTVVYDREGRLLGARRASDGQWRFPVGAIHLPEKFTTALLYYEDEYFYYHPGVNPVSLAKAAYQNLKAGTIKRGGSTITMQLARIVTGRGKRRTLWQKLKEISLALCFEATMTKDEILAHYSALAPFGGNIVGIKAATWRYFGRPPDELSWAEAAMLAILPNAPSLIHPGKNRTILLQKRNALLRKLLRKGVIDTATYHTALDEPLPDRLFRFPSEAYHLVNRFHQTAPGQEHFTTIDWRLQNKILYLLRGHEQALSSQMVYNYAVVVAETRTGKVRVYIGNSQLPQNRAHEQEIDMVHRRRSTGSTLKPVLYALCLKEGMILENSLVADIPTNIAGFQPKNFDKTYEGAVPAGYALAKSLNIPAVRLLWAYHHQRFHDVLQQLQLRSIDRPAEYYGLSLILGGAEASLYELTQLYCGMGQTLLYPHAKAINGLRLTDQPVAGSNYAGILGPENVWIVFDVLAAKHRPAEEEDWERFSSARKIAWKTGTSYGHRDAWCIGVTPQYTVGVWVGNADNTGIPELTGIAKAAPLMFAIFNALPDNGEWFAPPDGLVYAEVCTRSGHLASKHCPEKKGQYIQQGGLRSQPCSYHKVFWLDESESYIVDASCYPREKIRQHTLFVLPPAMAYYYQKHHLDYQDMPPPYPGCHTADAECIDVIYPYSGSAIKIPDDLNFKKQAVVLRAAHRYAHARLYWYLNHSFLGTTTDQQHVMTKTLSPGTYLLTLVDQMGNIKSVRFEVRN